MFNTTARQHAVVMPLQGYYRRGDANVALSKFKLALRDLKMAAKVAPRDADLQKKLLACEKEVKRIRFEEALATPVSGRSLCWIAVLFVLGRSGCNQGCWPTPHDAGAGAGWGRTPGGLVLLL